MIIRRSSLFLAIGLFALAALAHLILETSADARAGGGRAAGSRGSRSFQSPSRPTQPTAPQREAIPQQPQQPYSPGPQSGGFMRGLGTAVLGGFLGSMLFSGLANAGGFGGLGGSGFGMLELLLFAGLAYFLYRKFRSSRFDAVPRRARANDSSTRFFKPAAGPTTIAVEWHRLRFFDDDGSKLRRRSFSQKCPGYFFQSAGCLEQAGHGDIAFALRRGAHANLG